MPRSRVKIKKLVSARVDELIPAGDNVGGQTAIEAPTEIIEEELDYSAEYVLRTAKLPLLYPVLEYDKKHFHGDNAEDVDTRIIIDSETKKATVVCPDNFIRLVSLRLSGWKRDLKPDQVIDPNDPNYRFQEWNKYTGGNETKPMGALVGFSSYLGGAAGTSETIKWDIDQTLTADQTLSSLYNGQTPSGGSSLTTGDIIALTGQDDDDENGIYLVESSGAPTLITDKFTSNTGVNKFTAIECFRASSTSDTIDHFHYIPEVLPENMPDLLVDPMVWHCAGRVFEFMGMSEQSAIAMQRANELLGIFKVGIKGEG